MFSDSVLILNFVLISVARNFLSKKTELLQNNGKTDILPQNNGKTDFLAEKNGKRTKFRSSKKRSSFFQTSSGNTGLRGWLLWFFREKWGIGKPPIWLVKSLQSSKLRAIAAWGPVKSDSTLNLLFIDTRIGLTWLYADKWQSFECSGNAQNF